MVRFEWIRRSVCLLETEEDMVGRRTGWLFASASGIRVCGVAQSTVAVSPEAHCRTAVLLLGYSLVHDDG